MADRAAWADRAAATERAVTERSLRRLWTIPATALGLNSSPPSVSHRVFLSWNYWWQAHLLDCLVDAEIRDPRPARRRRITALLRAFRIRNLGSWTNRYYDDMAWLGLALQRCDDRLGTDHGPVIRRLADEIVTGWSDAEGGGIPWRRGDEFKNTPANAPAAILLARTGHLDRAAATVDWIDDRLRDPDTGLIWDGLRPAQIEKVVYSYCQGVVLGAELEVSSRTGRPRDRIHRLVAAVDRHLSSCSGVLAGHAGGDSGLFTGILARYLTLVAAELPVTDRADVTSRSLARRLVLQSAAAAWSNAAFVDGAPLFGADWSQPARVPSEGGHERLAERDLSVQLSGWMLMEAAAAVGD
ncbi:MAG TPA: glycoside hydrolase family 76 protein [Nakamurella sp.]